MEKLNIMIDKYIELSVIKNVNDEAYLLELMNNIKNEIDGLMPNELKVVYHEYLKKILELKSKIAKGFSSIRLAISAIISASEPNSCKETGISSG